MMIGKITKIENAEAFVEMTYGETLRFMTTHKSVTHGEKFDVGDEVSIRMSRDNSRVASVVPAQPRP